MMNTDTEITMFGKGWASFKGDKVPDGWLPQKNNPDEISEWIDGFMAADFEYPDPNETGMQALARIAPIVFNRCITQNGVGGGNT